MAERDAEAGGETAGPRIRLDAREVADGVWTGNDGACSFDLPPRPRRPDPWTEALRRRDAYYARQAVIWGRVRRVLFLLVCALGGLVAAVVGRG